ncbi:restriction endonuclease subunit S [Capnocytophaga sp. ARDL2]|uniref:restriction endonuclease subunit S n=1 Tax=Capnocytophaga sp. ARDL2 TaxID=3238809 RepID=UPI0035571DAA
MSKKVKISEVVNIRSGMIVPRTTNSDLNELTEVFVYLLNTTDFDTQGNLAKDLQPNALYKPVFEKNYLQKGDLLFNAKGRRFFAVQFKGEYPHCIASSVFLVLTVLSDDVLPEYVLWYLNHPKVLKMFESKMFTQTMPAISLKDFSTLEISIPPLEVQQKIVALDTLKNKKIQLMQQLLELETLYYDAKMFEML